MHPIRLLFFALPCATLCAAPLQLHPDNPHYFLWKEKPEVLVTSGEHYGAVLNLDFDFAKYLRTLGAAGMNLTRTFSGAYCEAPGAFKIERNTLAPAAGRFICPWARSDQPGYANGGNKFDLNRWDDAYFRRLRDFLSAAAEAGVIVEMNLFCPFYEDSMWNLSPMNARNNSNGIGGVKREEVYTLDKHGGLLAVHESMTRKLVTELNAFDNLCFEICNEPYFGGVTMAWQHRIADVIVETEKALPKKHLISQNIANGSAKISNPHPAVGIFNFHYAYLPDAVTANYGLNKVIGDNETGFKGTGDSHYRMEAWAFLCNGGALYNNLDYSFTAGHEDGTFPLPGSQPGGGTAELRRQLKILADFIRSFQFVRMKPQPEIIKTKPAGKRHAFALAEAGKQYAGYVTGNTGGVTVELSVPDGAYEGFWIDPVTGGRTPIAPVEPASGKLTLTAPNLPDGAGWRLIRRE
jgi:hypothetical protein